MVRFQSTFNLGILWTPKLSLDANSTIITIFQSSWRFFHRMTKSIELLFDTSHALHLAFQRRTFHCCMNLSHLCLLCFRPNCSLVRFYLINSIHQQWVTQTQDLINIRNISFRNRSEPQSKSKSQATTILFDIPHALSPLQDLAHL